MLANMVTFSRALDVTREFLIERNDVIDLAEVTVGQLSASRFARPLSRACFSFHFVMGV
jgi:hypothetical protein